MKATLPYCWIVSWSAATGVLLVVLVMYVWQSSLLGGSLHPVAPPRHQAVDDVHGVVAGTLQHKPAVRAVQEAGRVTAGVLLLQRLSVPGVQACSRCFVYLSRRKSGKYIEIEKPYVHMFSSFNVVKR